MESNEISWNEQVQEQRLSGSIENFFREYHVGTLLHRCGIRKCRGVSPMIVLHCLFGLSFLGDNIFRHMVVKARQPFGKDVVYDFLRGERFNWRRLLLLLVARAVSFIDALPVKLVFVRNRNSNDWLALLSTDTELPDEKIVELYGKRWDIEVFFKVTKQHLNLGNGIQARDFVKRRHDDPRTLGLLFTAAMKIWKI